MPPTAATPAYASVAFLRIPGFDTRSVGDQALLKDNLEQRAKKAIAAIPARDRIVLDSEDGLALVIFGDPERALKASAAMRADGDLLQIGVNYGPLALTARGSDARVLGDGLASAAAAARFATPERTLVTHDFVRALETVAPELAADFANAGDFTDTRVRQHSLFAQDPARGVQRRRRNLKLAVGGFAAILLLGFSAREVDRAFFSSPAIVKLVVKPRGEILVDGVSQGRVPPLTRVEVAAGKHVISIRNAGSPPLELEVRLKSGEEMTITHTFATPARRAAPAPAPAQEQKSDFWRDLKRKFGS